MDLSITSPYKKNSSKHCIVVNMKRIKGEVCLCIFNAKYSDSFIVSISQHFPAFQTLNSYRNFGDKIYRTFHVIRTHNYSETISKTLMKFLIELTL